jgi:hypothetical protein
MEGLGFGAVHGWVLAARRTCPTRAYDAARSDRRLEDVIYGRHFDQIVATVEHRLDEQVVVGHGLGDLGQSAGR